MQELYQVGRLTMAKDLKYYDSYDLAFSKSFGLPIPREKEKYFEAWIETYLADFLSGKHPILENDDWNAEFWNRFIEKASEKENGEESQGSPPNRNSISSSDLGLEGANSEAKGMLSKATPWTERDFVSYREDQILGTRSIQAALKEIRSLQRTGKHEFDLNSTIQRTCENGGDLEIVETRHRANSLTLLLFLDTGGSMTVHSRKVAELFQASEKLMHFKEKRVFYFHNIFHDSVYSEEWGSVPFTKIFANYRRNTKVILVGDASMAPYELLSPPYNPYVRPDSVPPKTGLEELKALVHHFPDSIWLNPERRWDLPTIESIREVVPMFPLTLAGIKLGVKSLMNKDQ